MFYLSAIVAWANVIQFLQEHQKKKIPGIKKETYPRLQEYNKKYPCQVKTQPNKLFSEMPMCKTWELPL